MNIKKWLGYGLSVIGVIICIISSISSASNYVPFGGSPEEDRIRTNKWIQQCKKEPGSSGCGIIPPTWQLGWISYYLCLWSIGILFIYFGYEMLEE